MTTKGPVVAVRRDDDATWSRETFMAAASALCGGRQVLDVGASDLMKMGGLPFADGSIEAMAVFDGLAQLPEAVLDTAVLEVGRVASRALFLRVARDFGSPLGSMSRADWERRFFAAGWCRHPLSQRLTPYEHLEREGALLLAFERLPCAASERYPLEWLAAERDLHMDMLRETGRRSDAHVARYSLAAQFVSSGSRVLDAACGLGYGTALLHDTAPDVSVLGLDLSSSAIAYARAVFGGRRRSVSFDVADVMATADCEDESFDVITSFETLEHIPDPGAFVADAARALAPGGRFICSVPNCWVDDTGRDPNPFHLHVFDLERLLGLLRPQLQIEHVLAQFAGGGMKHPNAARRFVPVPPGAPDDAEWWVVVAAKRHAGDMRRGVTTVMAEDSPGWLAAECRRLERERDRLGEQAASAAAALVRVRTRALARALADRRGVVIFGAGEGGRQAAAWWRDRGGQVAAFADNRRDLWGASVSGAEVVAPEALSGVDAALVLIASNTGASEIRAQLEAMGWCENVDFVTL